MTMPFVDAVEYAHGDDGPLARGGAGQKLAKAHSWLVPISPNSPALCVPIIDGLVIDGLAHGFAGLDCRWKDCRSAVSERSILAGFERKIRVSGWSGC